MIAGYLTSNIQRKVVAAILVASALACIGIALAIAIYEVSTFRPNTLNNLRAQANLLASTLAPPLLFNDPRAANSILGSLREVPDIAGAALYNAQGQQFAQYYPAEARDLPDILAGASSVGHAFVGNRLEFVTAVVYDSENVGFLRVDQTLKPLYARLPQYAMMIAVVVAALIVTGMLLSYALRRTIAQPIRELSELARGVTQQRDYSVRTQLAGRDEVGALAKAWNDMLETVQHEMAAHADAERALRISESRLSQFMDSLPIGVWVCDRQGRRVFANQRAAALLDAPPVSGGAGMQAQCCGAYIVGTQHLYSEDNTPIARALRGEACMVDDIELHQDGRVIPIEVHASPVYAINGDVEYAIAAFWDISERLRAQQDIQFLAEHDVLTGLANRRGFHERLELALATAKRHQKYAALLFIDLDRFKAVNDSFGHHVADNLLVATANRLRASVREIDTVARLGGDEFAVVVADLEAPEAINAFARKICAALASPYFLDGLELVSTASVGVSVFPRDGDNPDMLVRRADSAMYAAKQGGRNGCVVYSPDMDTDVSARMDVVQGLRRALAADEFVLFYQPQVDAKTGHCFGAEALIRWQHPSGRLIGPDQFISLAEDAGLIGDISYWTLREACRQVKQWEKQGVQSIRLAVNLSPIQFRHPDLIDSLKDILCAHDIDPRKIEIEITENIFMGSSSSAVGRTLSRMRDLGLTVSIDDFGTGYSSLSYLKNFPIDKLKIDQSFVRDITSDASDAAIAAAIIALGKELRLRVVAEGVETLAQAAFLADKGCDSFQGFLYGRPESARDFMARVQAQDLVLQ